MCSLFCEFNFVVFVADVCMCVLYCWHGRIITSFSHLSCYCDICDTVYHSSLLFVLAVQLSALHSPTVITLSFNQIITKISLSENPTCNTHQSTLNHYYMYYTGKINIIHKAYSVTNKIQKVLYTNTMHEQKRRWLQ